MNMRKVVALSMVAGLLVGGVFGCKNGGGGLLGGDRFTEEQASALILFVYGTLNQYAIYGPGEYGSGAVEVEDDYSADLINALYTNDVTVVFDQYSSGENTINGTGLVGAFMDSYWGKYGASYSGTFNGQYDGISYTLKMNYLSEVGTAGITSEGSFTVNGKKYEISADQDMIYSYFGL